jgi:hypothetical protein
VKLQRKGSRAAEIVPEPVMADELANAGNVGKGRPTPKRREAAPKRQPVAAPRTAKEANRWRKEQNAQARKNPSSAKALSTKEFRAAMRRGDESVLPRRDKGPVRKLTRDWVDTHRMASNYLLLVFPLLLFAGVLPNGIGTIITLAMFALFLLEWMWAGRRVHALAVERFGSVNEKAWVLGLYAGQRSFMPRRFRSPEAVLRPGDAI